MMMKISRIATAFLHLFIGIGACAGGTGAMLDPLSPMGAPVEMLEHSPFATFFIPGLFLFAVLGLCNVFSFILSVRIKSSGGYLSVFMGGILCLWLVIQCIFIRGIASLHIIFFILGLVQIAGGTVIVFRRRQFPYYNFLYFVERCRDRSRRT